MRKKLVKIPVQETRSTEQSTPKSKTKRHQWTDSDMELAVRAVNNGTMSQRQASQHYTVPRATLQTMISGKSHIGAKPGKKPLFTAEFEKKLIDYAGIW